MLVLVKTMHLLQASFLKNEDNTLPLEGHSVSHRSYCKEPKANLVSKTALCCSLRVKPTPDVNVHLRLL